MKATRQERVAQAAALRAQGFIYREISERLGLSISYVQSLITDPDGSQVRARKMKGACEDCGTAIHSDNPGRYAQNRCVACQIAWSKANAKWNETTVAAAIQQWAQLYGRPPRAQEWNSGVATSLEARARFKAGDYPWYGDVTHIFGRWSNAIRAAGFDCSSPLAGRPRNHVSDVEYRELSAMRASGATWKQIANHFNITTATAEQRWRRDQNMGHSLSAETVIQREIKRFEDRKARAEQEAVDFGETVRRLQAALAGINNGRSERAAT